MKINNIQWNYDIESMGVVTLMNQFSDNLIFIKNYLIFLFKKRTGNFFSFFINDHTIWVFFVKSFVILNNLKYWKVIQKRY